MTGCRSKKFFVRVNFLLLLLLSILSAPSVFGQNEPSDIPTAPASSDSAEPEQDAVEEMSEDEKEGVVDSKDSSEINILRGELATVRVHSLTRLSITDPNVADVANVDADKMMIIGKTVGQTIFFIWDEFGKKTFIVRVYEEDLTYIKSRVQKLFEVLQIEGVEISENVYEGKIILSGKLPADKLDILNSALGSLSGKIVNLVKKEESEDLVQIDMQVAELNTTLQKSLGFDWGAQTLTYTEAIPTSDNQIDRFIKIGEFTRTSALLLTINNLLEEGKARLLSKPRVLVISGKEARLQVGGQYPIKSSTTSAGGTSTESVSFKDYGIIMSMTPLITKGKIHIELTIEISDIDSSISTDNQGSVAFTTRSANTTVLLDDKQTIVIAGLIKNNKSITYSKVPILGDIPLVGFFFRSKQTPVADKETEVVITLTPTIIPQSEIEKDRSKTAANDDKEIKPIAEYPAVEHAADSPAVINEESAVKAEEPPVQDMLAAPGSGNVSEMEVPSELTPAQGEIAAQEVQPVTANADPAPTAMTSTTDAIIFEESVQEPEKDNTDLMAAYVKSIQKKISEAITYPYEASENGWSGTVKLTLHILKDGTLDEISVKETSGHEIFDQDAVNTAQILSPYTAFPPELDLKEIKVTIPIVYSQNSVSLDVVCRPKDKMEQVSNKPFSFSSGKTYAEMVQERIARSILYPEAARQGGWEGMVKLNLRISHDGTLADASVKESSGNSMFDECALQTAKTLAPYSVFPSDSKLQDLNLTVPIVYSLSK